MTGRAYAVAVLFTLTTYLLQNGKPATLHQLSN